MKINASGFQDVQTERVPNTENEIHREAVYRDGQPIGDVVYVSRRTTPGKPGKTYGWRPALKPRSALTTKHDAILKLRKEETNGNPDQGEMS